LIVDGPEKTTDGHGFYNEGTEPTEGEQGGSEKTREFLRGCEQFGLLQRPSVFDFGFQVSDLLLLDFRREGWRQTVLPRGVLNVYMEMDSRISFWTVERRVNTGPGLSDFEIASDAKDLLVFKVRLVTGNT